MTLAQWVSRCAAWWALVRAGIVRSSDASPEKTCEAQIHGNLMGQPPNATPSQVNTTPWLLVALEVFLDNLWMRFTSATPWFTTIPFWNAPYSLHLYLKWSFSVIFASPLFTTLGQGAFVTHNTQKNSWYGIWIKYINHKFTSQHKDAWCMDNER